MTRQYAINHTDPYKVSVIVPVYRVDKYIDRCIKSLRRQTLKEIEILCVCEKEDSSFEKLLRYAKTDSRIRVIEKKNTGVSAARNAGIQTATGTYLAFVDADDWIEPYALRVLYATAVQYDAQILAYGIWPAKEPAKHKRGIFSYSTKRNVSYHGNGMKALFYEHGSRPYIGNKFYNRRFLREHTIWFDESLAIGEDQFLQFEAFDKAERICFIREKLYHYEIGRDDSAMNACEKQKEAAGKNLLLLQRVMDAKKKRYGTEYDKDYTAWVLQDYGWYLYQEAPYVIVVQKYLKELSAREHIADLPEEYQTLCERFLSYMPSQTGIHEITLPYKKFDTYMAAEVAGLCDEIKTEHGIRKGFRRIYEAVVFHEARHLAMRGLMRMGII